jgi:hypothetical protein
MAFREVTANVWEKSNENVGVNNLKSLKSCIREIKSMVLWTGELKVF